MRGQLLVFLDHVAEFVLRIHQESPHELHGRLELLALGQREVALLAGRCRRGTEHELDDLLVQLIERFDRWKRDKILRLRTEYTQQQWNSNVMPCWLSKAEHKLYNLLIQFIKRFDRWKRDKILRSRPEYILSHNNRPKLYTDSPFILFIERLDHWRGTK